MGKVAPISIDNTKRPIETQNEKNADTITFPIKELNGSTKKMDKSNRNEAITNPIMPTMLYEKKTDLSKMICMKKRKIDLYCDVFFKKNCSIRVEDFLTIPVETTKIKGVTMLKKENICDFLKVIDLWYNFERLLRGKRD